MVEREKVWAVGEVEQLTGVPAATLRTWDRRYGLGPSWRTAGGHRRYTKSDLRRVARAVELIAAGVASESAATHAATGPS